MELTESKKYEFDPYFDQENPEMEITGMIADLDVSHPYELDASAVFKVKGRGYLVVNVSGCSCWPDYGATSQVYCLTKKRVQDAIREFSESYTDYAPLIDKLQNAEWKVQKKIS